MGYSLVDQLAQVDLVYAIEYDLERHEGAHAVHQIEWTVEYEIPNNCGPHNLLSVAERTDDWFIEQKVGQYCA